MALFTAEVTGLAQVDRMLIRLQDLGTMERYSLLRQLGNLIQKQHTRRVLSEKKTPGGAAWKPLKPSTVARKGNSNILVESGAMAKAWRLFVNDDNVVMRNTARSRRGKAVLYLPFHQFGTRSMGSRAVMGFSGQNKAEILRVVESWVGRRIGIAA